MMFHANDCGKWERLKDKGPMVWAYHADRECTCALKLDMEPVPVPLTAKEHVDMARLHAIDMAMNYATGQADYHEMDAAVDALIEAAKVWGQEEVTR